MGVEPGEPAPEAPAVVLRPATDGDLDYIYSTWLRSYLQHGVTLGWARCHCGPGNCCKFPGASIARCRCGGGCGGPAARTRYFAGQKAVIARLIDAAGARITIAGLPADTTTVLGWVTWNGPVDFIDPHRPVLHYVYTRQALRRAGVARTLLREVAPMEYTHLCSAPGDRRRGADWLAEWLRREWPLAAYNPYAVNP